MENNKQTLAQFAKNAPVPVKTKVGRKSKILPYKEEIKTMRSRGFSVKDIADALQEFNVKTTYHNVYAFCRNHLGEKATRKVKAKI